MKRQGFTIIELLVVIAIIAIIALIIVPIVGHTKNRRDRLTLVNPPTPEAVTVKSVAEDYVTGNGLHEPELSSLVNTDKGLMVIYNGLKWKDHTGAEQVTDRAKIQIQITSQAQSIVLVGQNRIQDKIIVAFVEPLDEESLLYEEPEEPDNEVQHDESLKERDSNIGEW